MESQNTVGFFNSNVDLESYLSETVMQASRNDEALKAAMQRASEYKNQIPKLTRVLDFEEPAELSVEDCKVLIEYLIANNSLAVEESRVCYMRGLIDGIEMKKTFE